MIKIGTCLKGEDFYKELENIATCGFEAIQLYFPSSLNNFNLEETDKIKDHLQKNRIEINSIGLYGNPIQDSKCRDEIIKCIHFGAKLGIKVFSTFAGGVENDLVESSLPYFKKYFTEFVSIAKNYDIKIGIENYPAYGFWYNVKSNIGFCPRAWEMMFNEINDEYLGLEWEPSHQIDQFINPISQLEEWVSKVVHVHGKDCHIDKEKLSKVGNLSCIDYSSHCFPGFGDTDWNKIFKILIENNYKGNVTIEGFHDPVYNNERELEGQILALEYLRKCRKI